MVRLPKLPDPNNVFSAIDKASAAIDKGLGFIDKVSDKLDKFGFTEEPHSSTPDTTSTIQDTEKTPEIQPQRRTLSPTTGVSKLTNEETLAYQNREIGRELWQLEKHLSQGCRIPDRTGKPVPCDCCEKGSFIAGLAYESIPIAERASSSSAIYQKIAKWAEELTPMVTVPAVESGQYDYKKISGQASALRKELMGSLALGAMIESKEQITLDEAKKLAVEEATKEIEKRWGSQEKKSKR